MALSAARMVVPLAGTWIEIPCPSDGHIPAGVVPLAGTWIEMMDRSQVRAGK